MKKKILTVLCLLAMLVSVLAVTAAAEGGELTYDKMPEDNMTWDIIAAGNYYLDLDGLTVEKINLVEGATVYVKDSATDDYTVNDGNGYGKILEVTGAGTVVAADGYVKIVEDGVISVHAVDLELKTLTLRTSDVGMYYKSNFKADEVVARNVETFGVALSTTAIPNAENLETDCKSTAYDAEFVGGTAGNDNDATSTALVNIMKPGNGYLTNKANANTKVYGRAYIRTSGGYAFGTCAAYSLCDALELYSGQLESSAAQVPADVQTLYSDYAAVMNQWDISYIIDAVAAAEQEAEDSVLKILGIGNSFTIDCMKPLYNIYKEHNPDQEVVLGIMYYSGCTLAQHVEFLTNNQAVYDYYECSDATGGEWKITNDVTLRYGIEQDKWDIVTMQQGVKQAAQAKSYNEDISVIRDYVKVLLGYEPEFAWNMTWGLPMDADGTAGVLKDYPKNTASYNYYSDFVTNFTDTRTMYTMISAAVNDKIINGEYAWDYMMPVGTAIQNANDNYDLEDVDLYADYCHIRGLGSLIAAYTWYCTFEGITELDAVSEQLQSLSLNLVRDRNYSTDDGESDFAYEHLNADYATVTSEGITFTDAAMQIVLEAVNDALSNNFAVTDRTAD